MAKLTSLESLHCHNPHVTTSVPAHVHMWHGTQIGRRSGWRTRSQACYAASVSGCCNFRRTGATALKSQESFSGARAPCAPLVPPPMLSAYNWDCADVLLSSLCVSVHIMCYYILICLDYCVIKSDFVICMDCKLLYLYY